MSEDEKKLIEAVILDPEKFGEIIDRYETKLDRFLSHLGVGNPEDREDLLQEIFWKVFRNLNDFDADLSFSAWIYRIARHHVYDFYRRIKSRREAVSFSEEEYEVFWQNILDETQDLASDLDMKKRGEMVVQILEKVPEKYREVLILLFIEDKSYAEISDILQKNENTVATLISRGKQQFKNLFLQKFSLTDL